MMRPFGIIYSPHTGHALINIFAPDKELKIREAIQPNRVEFDEVLVIGREVGRNDYQVLTEINTDDSKALPETSDGMALTLNPHSLRQVA